MPHSQPITSQGRTDPHTDMPVGEILRRSRVHYGQSVEDVEAVLRIRGAHLIALEEGRLADLPGRVYAIGFVRTYSEYLGLDGEKMVQLFKTQSVGNRAARPELNFPVAASESKLPGMLLIGVSFAAIILIVSLFSIFHHHSKAKQAQEDIPAVSSQIKSDAQTPVPTVLPAVAPQAAPAPTPAVQGASALETPATPATTPSANRIVINVKDTTWLEIRNSAGKAIISQVLNPGDKYLVPNEDGLVLATGNIGGLEFVVDGATVPALGNQGDVARGIRLDPDAMRGKAPKPASASAVAPAAVADQADSAWQTSIHQTTTPAAAPPAAAPSTSRPAAKRLTPEDEAYKPKRNRIGRDRSEDDAYKAPPARTDNPYAMPSPSAQQAQPAATGEPADPYARLPANGTDSPYGSDVE